MVNRFKDPEQPRQSPHLCRMDNHLAGDNREKHRQDQGSGTNYSDRDVDNKFFVYAELEFAKFRSGGRRPDRWNGAGSGGPKFFVA